MCGHRSCAILRANAAHKTASLYQSARQSWAFDEKNRPKGGSFLFYTRLAARGRAVFGAVRRMPCGVRGVMIQ